LHLAVLLSSHNCQANKKFKPVPKPVSAITNVDDVRQLPPALAQMIAIEKNMARFR
jgi:hypothetical protein